MFRFHYDEVLSILLKNNYYDELNSINELFIPMFIEIRCGEVFVVIDNNISQSVYSGVASPGALCAVLSATV